MSVFNQWLMNEGYNQFSTAKQLFEDLSSPEEQPYLCKYKSRDILKTLKSKLEDFSEDGIGLLKKDNVASEKEVPLVLSSDEKNFTIHSFLAVIYYELGINFIECEEVTTGEQYFKSTLNILHENQSSKIHSSLSIATYNQLAIICSRRSLFEQSLKYLNLAEKEYKLQGSNNTVIYYEEIWQLKKKDNSRERFENLHTLTLYYLAQVYGSLGNQDLSAKYCHVTLVRQMESKTYNPREWSLNCATLSQFYITQEEYTLARYCLACAEYINKEAVNSIPTLAETAEETKSQLEERILKSKADIARCWAKYGLNLLKDSHFKNVEISNHATPVEGLKSELTEIKELVFPGLETAILEEKVADKYASEFSEAKNIFLFSTKCLQDAEKFYKLDGYVSDFVEMTQDTSQLYKYLAFFDNEFENRCKMHKRRIDMLNSILVELNPQHFLQICRQLTFEIAETYNEMAELKKAIIKESPQKLSVNSVKKINLLILKAIKYYTGFIDSYKHEGKLPVKFEDDDVRGVLLCYFCMARLNSNYVTNDRETKVKYLLQEKECYEFIVNYSNENKDMPNVFEQELPICVEMLALHSAKMNKFLDNL